MSLYQKPGNQSSEYGLMCAVLIGAGVMVSGGFTALIFGPFGAGLVLTICGSSVAAVAVAAYAYSRSKVKVAAEQARPPQSRIV